MRNGGGRQDKMLIHLSCIYLNQTVAAADVVNMISEFLFSLCFSAFSFTSGSNVTYSPLFQER